MDLKVNRDEPQPVPLERQRSIHPDSRIGQHRFKLGHIDTNAIQSAIEVWQAVLKLGTALDPNEFRTMEPARLAAFCLAHQHHNTNLEPNLSTIRAYWLDIHLYLSSHPNCIDVTQDQISDWTTQLHAQYTGNTVRRKLSAMNTFYVALLQHHLVASNPFALPKWPNAKAKSAINTRLRLRARDKAIDAFLDLPKTEQTHRAWMACKTHDFKDLTLLTIAFLRSHRPNCRFANNATTAKWAITRFLQASTGVNLLKPPLNWQPDCMNDGSLATSTRSNILYFIHALYNALRWVEATETTAFTSRRRTADKTPTSDQVPVETAGRK